MSCIMSVGPLLVSRTSKYKGGGKILTYVMTDMHVMKQQACKYGKNVSYLALLPSSRIPVEIAPYPSA